MHFLFTWEQGGGYGHLGHLYPIARHMKAAGHQVTLAVRQMENVWSASDMPFDRVLPAPNVRAASLKQDTRTFSDVIRPGGFASAQMLTACTRGWSALFDLLRPDAVVCEHAYNAQFAAYVYNITTAHVGTGFTVPNAGAPLPPMRTWQPHAQAECERANADLLRVLNDTAESFGATPFESVTDFFGYGKDFVASWPELDHLGPQKDRFYYGPMEGLKGSAHPQWPSTAKPGLPRVFMYLPGEHPHEPSVLEALSLLGWPTVFHSRTPPPGPLAANMTYSAEPVDTAAVLKEADVFITHGSHGTCADALRAGCRQILFPNSFERTILALQMVRSGLATLPTGDLKAPAAMAEALTKAANNTPVNLQRVSDVYKGYSPALAAQELCEDLLTYIEKQVAL